MSETGLIRLLPLACLAAAACLFASELMVMFEFTPPGGEPQGEQGAGERHGNAMFVVAAFAAGAVLVTVLTGSKPAATAVAAAGLVGLLLFLLLDLPDAGAVGTFADSRQSFIDAEAVPREGFWLALVGSLGLAVSGIALATLTPEQLAALRPGARRDEGDARAERHGAGEPAPEPRAGALPGPYDAEQHEAARELEEPTRRRARRRSRTRPRG